MPMEADSARKFGPLPRQEESPRPAAGLWPILRCPAQRARMFVGSRPRPLLGSEVSPMPDTTRTITGYAWLVSPADPLRPGLPDPPFPAEGPSGSSDPPRNLLISLPPTAQHPS